MKLKLKPLLPQYQVVYTGKKYRSFVAISIAICVICTCKNADGETSAVFSDEACCYGDANNGLFYIRTVLISSQYMYVYL